MRFEGQAGWTLSVAYRFLRLGSSFGKVSPEGSGDVKFLARNSSRICACSEYSSAVCSFFLVL